ncbi:cell wall-binding repeat-containing protein [Catenulispora sp. GP43]|uniref:cell wall-binding repeat-containing protein n=1 Tax=Catenulispora sp. GP43 TaxID=3156263 RepID=UPI0035194CB9
MADVGRYGFEGRPAWSADGQWIYVQDTRGLETGACGVVIDRIRPDGGQQEQIATFATDKPAGGCPGYTATLSSSVNGDLAISANGNLGVRIWHHSDGSLTQLNYPNLIPAEADYSPDGKSLVFVGQELLNNGGYYSAGIFVGSVTSATVNQIVSTAGDPNLPGGSHDFRTPVWAPDGSAIAYLDQVDNGSSNPDNSLLLYSFATGQSRALTGFHPSAPLTWRPRTVPLPPRTVPTVDRIGGQDRIGTAVNASRFEFANAGTTAATARTASCAVLTRSDSYADALSGSALAGAKGCPLLLTPHDSLDPAVEGELHRVLPRGATVYVLGGSAALSPTIDDELARAGFVPHRLKGDDRYATSIAIAGEITPHPKMVFVATGDNFPDALAAGAVASSRADAVVLTLPAHGMTTAARAYISSAMADSQTTLVAVGSPGFDSIRTLYSIDQINAWILSGRMHSATGGDRYETAAALFMNFGTLTHQTVALATGNNWADALAGGSVAGMHNGLMLLTNGSTFPAREGEYLQDPRGGVSEVLVFGGTTAVPPGAVTAFENATGESGWRSFDNRTAPIAD